MKNPPPGQNKNTDLLQSTIPGLTANQSDLFQQSSEFRYEMLQREMQMAVPPLSSVLTKENVFFFNIYIDFCRYLHYWKIMIY